MLNEILECHIVGAHALPHEVSAFIYIYILILLVCSVNVCSKGRH